MPSKIIYPIHFLTIKRDGTTWYFRYGNIFFNRHNRPVVERDRERMYGLTKEDIAVQLFRIAGGRAGYYLVDLRRKKYYYCGPIEDGIRLKLRELGIGRDEPSYPETD